MRNASVLLSVFGTGTLFGSILLIGTDTVLLRPLIAIPPFEAYAEFIFLLGAIAGGITTLAISSVLAGDQAPGASGPDARRRLNDVLLAIALIGAAAILLREPQTEAATAAVAYALLSLAMVSGLRCAELLAQGEAVGFESYWGGLGAGGGGWRILPASALAALCLASIAGAVAIARPLLTPVGVDASDEAPSRGQRVSKSLAVAPALTPRT